MNDTKDIIIDQAYKLFLSKSYESVSISDISKSIGLTKGALYHHFLNKEELFKAVIDKYMTIIGMGDLKEDISLSEFIQSSTAYVKQIVQKACINDGPFIPVQYISLLIDALRHYPGFGDRFEHMADKEIIKVKFILDQAVKSEEIREDINTSLLALNFFSISTGVAANLFMSNLPSDAIDIYESQMNEFYKVLKK